jgi:hypothetical protein
MMAVIHRRAAVTLSPEETDLILDALGDQAKHHSAQAKRITHAGTRQYCLDKAARLSTLAAELVKRSYPAPVVGPDPRD